MDGFECKCNLKFFFIMSENNNSFLASDYTQALCENKQDLAQIFLHHWSNLNVEGFK